MRFRRRHPSERALRRWGQLSPELRELIVRAARREAKDAVQDVMEDQGLVFLSATMDPIERQRLKDQRAHYRLNPFGAALRSAERADATKIIHEKDEPCES